MSKKSTKDQNMEIIKASGVDFKVDNNGSVIAYCGDGRAIFYPTTNKWQYRQTVHSGDASLFLKYLEKHGEIIDPSENDEDEDNDVTEKVDGVWMLVPLTVVSFLAFIKFYL